MARYSNGKHAWAIDDQSGFRVKYTQLRTQWNGLKVADPDFDTRHPQETPARSRGDSYGLRDPRPDRDDDSTAVSWTTYTATTQLHEVLSMTFGSMT